jgi:hypothetical protein
MPADLRTLRGAALEQLAHRLEVLRREGKACHRCDRILAPGALCPEHGKTWPPTVRFDVEWGRRG